MATDESITPSAKAQSVEIKSATLASNLFECAVEALLKTALILIIGSFAIRLVGGIFHDMTPSTPPAMKGQLVPGGHLFSALTSSFQKHRFVIVFALVFGLTSWMRLRPPSPGGKQTVVEKFGRRFSGRWFGTLVGNAFAAMGIAIALYWLEQFSVSGWVWAWFVHSVLPGIQSSGNHLLGTHRVDTIKDWFAWYGANQLKFNFWIIYLAAICDDLGVPNLKSLAGLLVQRVRNRQIRSSPSHNSEITPAA